MDREIIVVLGVRGSIDENGDAHLNLEDLSRGLGFTRIATSGNVVVRWDRVRGYLEEIGIPTSGHDATGREGLPDYIQESYFYLLSMKANNETAVGFQRKVAFEILPTIRKTGSYSVQHKLPQTMPEALRLYAAQIEETDKARAETMLAQAKVEEQRPLVLFAESLQISEDSILVSVLATLLKQNGMDTGERRLFAHLRNEGYLIKSGSEYNLPTQRSMDLKIIEVEVRSRSSSDGTVKITKTPKITGKGQVYFMNKFINKVH